MTTKAKRVRAVKRYQGDSGMIYPNDCAPRRADAGYFFKQSDVPALIEQMAKDARDRFLKSDDSTLEAEITYALKRAGITAGRKA